MGEAKQRAKEIGALKAKPQGRGLLFPQRMSSPGGALINLNQIPANDYHSAILYWDRFACPTNNLIHVDLPSEDTLMKEGILVRPRAVASGKFDGSDIVRMAAAAQIRQFAELERSDPGYWCLTGTQPDDLAATSEFTTGRSALLELINSLPLPPEDTPIENLLEFKLKRKDELQRMRSALDKVYLQIAGSPDQQMSIEVAVEEIDRAIADLHKISREWWKEIKLSDMKTLVNLGAPAVVGALLGSAIAMPAIGAIAGGVASFFNIKNSIQSKLKKDRSSPYWYAVSVKKELGA
jgi:hypothetical protein